MKVSSLDEPRWKLAENNKYEAKVGNGLYFSDNQNLLTITCLKLLNNNLIIILSHVIFYSFEMLLKYVVLEICIS